MLFGCYSGDNWVFDENDTHLYLHSIPPRLPPRSCGLDLKSTAIAEDRTFGYTRDKSRSRSACVANNVLHLYVTVQ